MWTMKPTPPNTEQWFDLYDDNGTLVCSGLSETLAAKLVERANEGRAV